MFKKIIINNEITPFIVNEEGVVKNTQTNNILKGTIRDGYRYYDLRFNHKKVSKSGHRLVAETFLPNPDGYKCVHHIDGNRLNNHVDNLKWCSYSYNNLKVNKNSASSNWQNPSWTEDEQKEQWVNYKNTCYSVSSNGKVRNNKTNKLLKGKKTGGGYIEYQLTIDGKKISILGHRLIYASFYPFVELLTINHIDGNKLNNKISNLENITQLENNMKSIHETQSRKFRQVGQFDQEGNLIQIFLSCADAAKSVGCRPQSINSAIHNNYCSCGYYWKYIN